MRVRDGLVLLALWVTPAARGGDEEMARFEREYPEAARKLEEAFAKVKGECRLIPGRATAANGARPQSASFAADHGHEKVMIEKVLPAQGAGRKPGEIVYGVGPGTIFNLIRLPGSDGYIVEGIGETAADRSAYNMLFGRFFKAHYGVFGVPMTKLLSSPRYRLLSAEPVQQDGRSLLRVEFEAGASGTDARVIAVVDPEAGWCLRSSEYRAGGSPGIRITAEVEYDDPSDGLPRPRRVVFRDDAGESPSCEFLKWSFEPTPAEEFGMAFYGLPDLVNRRASVFGGPTLWFAIAGVVALGLAIAFRKLGNRAPAPGALPGS